MQALTASQRSKVAGVAVVVVSGIVVVVVTLTVSTGKGSLVVVEHAVKATKATEAIAVPIVFLITA